MTVEQRVEWLERELARTRRRASASALLAIAAIGITIGSIAFVHGRTAPSKLQFGNVALDETGLKIASNGLVVSLGPNGLDASSLTTGAKTAITIGQIEIVEPLAKTSAMVNSKQVILRGASADTIGAAFPGIYMSVSSTGADLQVSGLRTVAELYSTAVQATVHVNGPGGDHELTSVSPQSPSSTH